MLMFAIYLIAALPFAFAYKTVSLHSRSKLCNNKHFSQNKSDLFSIMSKEISLSINRPFNGVPESGGYLAGGGGASIGVIMDPNSKQSYFYKSSGLYGFDMLKAEFIGIKTMYETHTFRVPQPITYGTSDHNSYVVFEKLTLGGRGSDKVYAEKLAAMHKCTSPNDQFGFHINNTIGVTFQPNNWEINWADFFIKHRLNHMFALCRNDGLVFSNEKEFIQKVHILLTNHCTLNSCPPSLVHGDLWSGNQAYTKEGEPCIYDPATYYGDREVDIAMTKLFGMNSNEFYSAYDAAYPRPQGWEIREQIYNLYHILNHYVLFGGGYGTQAARMIDRILASI